MYCFGIMACLYTCVHMCECPWNEVDISTTSDMATMWFYTTAPYAMSGFPVGFNICFFYLYLLLSTSTTCLQWMQVYQPSRHRPHSYSWNPTVMWPRKTLSSTDSNMESLARTSFHERYGQCVGVGAFLLKWLYMCYKCYRKGTAKHMYGIVVVCL